MTTPFVSKPTLVGDLVTLQPRARHVYEKVGFVHEGAGRAVTSSS